MSLGIVAGCAESRTLAQEEHLSITRARRAYKLGWVYTSGCQRSQQTCWLALSSCQWPGCDTQTVQPRWPKLHVSAFVSPIVFHGSISPRVEMRSCTKIVRASRISLPEIEIQWYYKHCALLEKYYTTHIMINKHRRSTYALQMMMMIAASTYRITHAHPLSAWSVKSSWKPAFSMRSFNTLTGSWGRR